MSFRVSSSDLMERHGTCDSFSQNADEEWVEIIEPKSKTKIYANLDRGICSKIPPEGVTVLKTDDFDDHWWELFDKNSGKYYYYNPDQQKTVWSRPNSSPTTNGSSSDETSKRRLLIIPVSKLQTFRKLSPITRHDTQIKKCDASTQTIASNFVTTGTQTFSQEELCKRINEVEIQTDHRDHGSQRQKPSLLKSPNDSPIKSRISSRIAEYQNVFKSQQAHSPRNHRQSSLNSGKAETLSRRSPDNGDKNQSSQIMDPIRSMSLEQEASNSQSKSHKSSQNDQINERLSISPVEPGQPRNEAKKETSAHDYFSTQPPPPPLPPVKQQLEQKSRHRSENMSEVSSTSKSSDSNHPKARAAITTFKGFEQTKPRIASDTIKSSFDQDKPDTVPANENQTAHDHHHGNKPGAQVVTNNLSHYLVREARAMGIALISDDELDDDDQDSDDEFANDDDEDTDLRDDLSSTMESSRDLTASQDLGDESGEAIVDWRLITEHESPNAQHKDKSICSKQPVSYVSNRRKYTLQQPPPSQPRVPQSPIHCETAVFKYNDDDSNDQVASASQQLNHKKLVENFKKTRQTSALGFNDSLGRSYISDANHAVQRLKTVADTYFGNGANLNPNYPGTIQERESSKSSDRYLRHLSTLSTLPRPIKARPPQVPKGADLIIDADYDVVEENCSYSSEGERKQAAELLAARIDASPHVESNVQGKKINNDHSSPMTNYFDRNKSTRGSTFSVESFARENLTRHPKKGLFNRKVKWTRMITWTKNAIKQPMISSVNSDLTSESIASFKLIQQFMGDRKITLGKKYRQLLIQAGLSEQEISSMAHRKSLGRSGSLSTGTNQNNNSSNNAGQNQASTNISGNYLPDRLRDELAFELTVKGCVNSALRDEIFIQLARQLTQNPSSDSTNWGLVLISILLNYFSPSSKFAPFLLSFLETHAHQMARDVCLPRLEKRLRQNWLTYCRKPADGKEISIVRLSITKWPQYCGVFGESLDRIMSLQSCSTYLRTLRLPWILTTLGEKLLETGGNETEGIFRCAADHDLLAQLRLEIDCVDFRKITNANQLKSLLSNVDDPHVIAGLLKLFFRQLCEPVFPSNIYDICLASCQDASKACRVFSEHLPNLNKDIVAYLARLLQLLSHPNNVMNTKMDTANLSMVWAPNLLRAPEFISENLVASESKSGSKWSISNGLNNSLAGDEQQQSSGPPQPSLSQSMIFEQARQEMQFIKLLITNLDTSFIENVL